MGFFLKIKESWTLTKYVLELILSTQLKIAYQSMAMLLQGYKPQRSHMPLGLVAQSSFGSPPPTAAHFG